MARPWVVQPLVLASAMLEVEYWIATAGDGVVAWRRVHESPAERAVILE